MFSILLRIWRLSLLLRMDDADAPQRTKCWCCCHKFVLHLKFFSLFSAFIHFLAKCSTSNAHHHHHWSSFLLLRVFQKIILQVGLKYGKGVVVLECIVFQNYFFERKKKKWLAMANVNYSICKGRLEKAKNNLFQLAICLVMLSKTYPPTLYFYFVEKNPFFPNYFVRIIRSCKQVKWRLR